jgi:hypothetical protein
VVKITKARSNGCLSKNSYRNREDAIRVANFRHEVAGVELRVYPCQFGYHFHLTKKPLNEKCLTTLLSKVQGSRWVTFDDRGRVTGRG